MTKKVAVIGGGASGLVGAIFAAENGNDVTIYESGERVGRKILATGNGRCNMTNINADVDHYYGRNPKFILGAKNRFWVDDTIDFFTGLGILTKTEDGGKVYPYSDQASAVLDLLRFRLEALGVKIVTSFEVKTVKSKGEGFTIISYDNRNEYADSVIVATGGKAAPNLGSKGGGYDILKSFGHKMTELSPTLVQIKTETEIVKKLKGIKLNATVSIGKNKCFDELLFTEYGLSGPAVFSLSSKLNDYKVISVDIMSDYTEEDLYEMLCQRAYMGQKITLENFFVGMINKRVGQALLKSVGIEPLSRYSVTLSDKEIRLICQRLKNWEFKIMGTMSWNNAQATRGGMVTDEFNPNTMESKLKKNLYATGEVLDIDGDCGGYNLQWAWSSGALAGKNA